MKNEVTWFALSLVVLGASLTTCGCKSNNVDAAAEAPLPPR